MLNKVTLIGRLIKDPLTKNLPSGRGVATFTLATNFTWVDAKTKEKRESVEFHSIVCWGKFASVATKYLIKGSKVYIEGRLMSRTWEDKAKQKHYHTDIITSRILMLGGGRNKEGLKKSQFFEDNITIEEVPMIEDDAE
jgi:single-strand DNA-binding protein